MLEILTKRVEDAVAEPWQNWCMGEHNEIELHVYHIMGMQGDYIGCEVGRLTGLPYIELQTWRKAVVGYWGSHEVSRHYSDSDKVASYWKEYYDTKEKTNEN